MEKLTPSYSFKQVVFAVRKDNPLWKEEEVIEKAKIIHNEIIKLDTEWNKSNKRFNRLCSLYGTSADVAGREGWERFKNNRPVRRKRKII
ncbi:MAG: hypothetical protein GX457_15640 [Thermotogaceae bacterium]|nr:hypothetical protein [Thermotogaceae bacterium]